MSGRGADRAVGLYDDPAFREHDAGHGHPERPERLDALRRGLREAGLEERLRLLTPRPASGSELLRVHTREHMERVESSAGHVYRFDADTQAGPRSYAAAILAAGAVVDAVDRVLDGDLEGAFCAVRPPGHHAESGRAMGFCLFNNVAVGAAHALARGLERVLIVDFDVHHGNGTQAIFASDPRVLYISSHAFPFYPGTGSIGEVGDGPGRGFTVNLPLPNGMDDGVYARLYREIVAPLGSAFAPQLVLVSAGFDAYYLDPLAGMSLSERGFGELAQVCLDVASGSAAGRCVFALEGGYDLEGIAACSAAVVAPLLGVRPPPMAETPSPLGDRLVHLFRAELGPFWPVLRG